MTGWSTATIGSADEMCDCPVLPVNRWRVDGRWTAGRTISVETADSDAAEYTAGPYDGWMIECPACHRVYAGGGPA